MKNTRGPGGRIRAKAAAPRFSGVPCVEKGIVGFPVTNALTGQHYSLDINQNEKQIALIAGSAFGDTVHIATADGALSKTAKGVAGPGGTVPLGRVVELSTDPGVDPSFPAGFMWILQLPQTA